MCDACKDVLPENYPIFTLEVKIAETKTGQFHTIGGDVCSLECANRLWDAIQKKISENKSLDNNDNRSRL